MDINVVVAALRTAAEDAHGYHAASSTQQLLVWSSDARFCYCLLEIIAARDTQEPHIRQLAALHLKVTPTSSSMHVLGAPQRTATLWHRIRTSNTDPSNWICCRILLVRCG
jgi:hypothetical protein